MDRTSGDTPTTLIVSVDPTGLVASRTYTALVRIQATTGGEISIPVALSIGDLWSAPLATATPTSTPDPNTPPLATATPTSTPDPNTPPLATATPLLAPGTPVAGKTEAVYLPVVRR